MSTPGPRRSGFAGRWPRPWVRTLGAGLAAVLLAGCGAMAPEPTSGASSTSTAAEPAEPAQPAEPAFQLDGFPTVDPSVTLFEVVGEDATTRTVEHERGTSTIPRDPQRIVMTSGTEILASLGVTPVGYVTCCDVPPSVRDLIPGAEFVQVVDGPDFEAVAALEPDLIMGSGLLGASPDDPYDTFAAIAPTIAFRINEATYWKDSTRLVATLLGREDRAEEVIADYDRRVAELRTEVQGLLGEGTVSPVYFFGGVPYLYGPTAVENDRVQLSSYVGWLYRELGLEPGPDVRDLFGAGGPHEDEGFVELSAESLDQLTADHLVVFPGGYTGYDEANPAYDAYVAQPVWQTVPAARSGQVYEVTVNRTEGCYSFLLAMEALRDAVRGAR